MRTLGRALSTACALAAAIGCVSATAFCADPQPSPTVDFHRQVWPILKTKCVSCHQPSKREGGLDLSTRQSMLKGGHSGAAFVPGNTEKSLMIELIEFDEMPPRKQKEGRVTADELKTLRAWIAAGAPVPDVPVPDVPVPDDQE